MILPSDRRQNYAREPRPTLCCAIALAAACGEGMVTGVLDGVRVLDFGRYIAGPFCAALLADLGAEVIRIERLGGAEDRFFIPVGAGPDGGGAMFLAMNRNKLGMTLDPAAPKGREIVRRLVATADVVVANLPPLVLRALALDLDSLRQVKPDIILATVTGFGAGGPLSDKHGFDGIGQAMSGAAYLSGTPEQPIACKLPWVDFGTACLSAFGTMAALYERGKTGRGQKVEGALLKTAIAFANATLIEQALTRVDRVATVNRGFNAAPADLYRCKDGWIVTTVIGPAMFRRWTRMIGEDHWLEDPRFADDQARADHGEIIATRMNQWCAERSCAEALAALEAASIVAGELYSPQQALDDPHIRAAHLLDEVPHPTLNGTLPLAPTPIELSETPGTYRRPAPRLGEHTDQILSTLGYSAAEIAALREEKVVYPSAAEYV
jgi:crotonobetainyl-CoA:carnitine CoA-transferase CaiB-like acyl-CoA transferase